MGNLYVAKLEKHGYMVFTSHLDLIRLFKNAFKIAGIKLVFSYGFSPHPKMSFAQPLSLGYSSSYEVLEFETKEGPEPDEIKEKMNRVLPEGVRILSVSRGYEEKSLASRVKAATYEITIPAGESHLNEGDKLCQRFLQAEKIIAEKKQKKTGAKGEIDIKKMIRSFTAETVDDNSVIYANLDTGSLSNLSPELLISAFISFAGIKATREEIDVERTGLFF